MAFKMKGSPAKMGTIQGTAGHSSALKAMKEKSAAKAMKEAAAMKAMKEDSAMKAMKKDSPANAMKKDSPAKAMKKDSAVKQAKPDFPDIDGDGNTTESMKKAAADKKSGVKMKKDSPAKQVTKDGKKGPYRLDTSDSEKNIKESTKKKSDPYAKALKKDPKLASYIRDRKKHKPGSAEYEALQAKINKAYGKTRSSKLKAAQIAAQKKKDATKSTTEVKPTGDKKIRKMDKRYSEREENRKVQDAKRSRKYAKEYFGKGSKEEMFEKLNVAKAKGEDLAGAQGGKKAVLFGNLRRKMNKRRQERLEKKLKEQEAKS